MLFITELKNVESKEDLKFYLKRMFHNEDNKKFDIENIEKIDSSVSYYRSKEVITELDMSNNLKAYEECLNNLDELDFKKGMYHFVSSMVFYNELMEDVLFSNMLDIGSYELKNGVYKPKFVKSITKAEEYFLTRIKFRGDELKFHRKLYEETDKANNILTYKEMSKNDTIRKSFFKFLVKVELASNKNLVNVLHAGSDGNIYLYKIFKSI